MSDMLNTTGASPEPPQVLSADVPCIGCGYNLRTLARSAICPECARPVMDSLHWRNLHLADVRWLARLHRGTALMGVAAVFMTAVLMLVVFNAMFGGTIYIELGLMGGFTLMTFFWVAGVWVGMAAEPVLRTRAGLRWANRLLAAASLPCIGVLVTYWVLTKWFSPGLYLPNWLAATVYILMYVIAYLSPMLVCLYFRDMDERGHRPALKGINTLIAAILGLGLTVVITALVLQAVLHVQLSSAIVLLIMLATYVASIALGVVGLVGHWRMFSRAMSGRRSNGDPD